MDSIYGILKKHKIKFDRQLISRLYAHKFVRYLLVGGTTFVLDIGLLFFFKLKVGTDLAIATSLGYWISILYNFTLNRWWSFSISDVKNLHKHALAYGLLLAINYAFTLGFVTFFSHYIYFGIAKVLSVLIQMTWTYPLYKHFVFKNNERYSPD